MRGQHLNWDSKNALKRIFILLKSKYFFILDNVENFLFVRVAVKHGTPESGTAEYGTTNLEW